MLDIAYLKVLHKINERLNNTSVNWAITGRPWFCTSLVIEGIKVEIMGDVQKRLIDGIWENPVDLEHYKRIVEVEGMQVPLLSLKYEYQAYLKLGRIDKAEMLRKWLQGKNETKDINNKELRQELHYKLGATACNWETSSVLKTAQLNGI